MSHTAPPNTTNGSTIAALIRAARPHQWSKNALLALPLLTAHAWADTARLANLAMAFAAYCLAASSVYLVNDVLDRRHDRQHPTKKFRPIASGALGVPVAVGATVVIIAGAAALAAIVGPQFAVLLAVYVVLSTAYSMYLKRKAVMDVILLAGLYSLRIIAGGAAVDLFPSAWLLAFSTFFFLSLALAKRYAELHEVELANKANIAGRGYRPGDLPLLASAGLTSGYTAVVVFALYVSGPKVAALYQSPALMWLMLPLLLYWLTRFWLIVVRGGLKRDPVLFTMLDRVSWIALLAAMAIVVVAAEVDIGWLAAG